VEIIGDGNIRTITLHEIIRDKSEEMIHNLSAIRYCLDTFHCAKHFCETTPALDFRPMQLAINEFIVRRMSRGGLGKSFAWSDRLRGGQPGDVNAWETAIEQLPAISTRLQGVTTMVLGFSHLIKHYATPGMLIYADPPYMHESRTAKNAYQHEMTNSDHLVMLSYLKAHDGPVMISGYATPTYTEALHGWRLTEFAMSNHAGQGKSKQRRVECLWANFSGNITR
jgi:DNA adenine methylase